MRSVYVHCKPYNEFINVIYNVRVTCYTTAYYKIVFSFEEHDILKKWYISFVLTAILLKCIFFRILNRKPFGLTFEM